MNNFCIALLIVWARISQLTSNNGQDIIASNDCESWKNEARSSSCCAPSRCAAGAHPHTVRRLNRRTQLKLRLAQGILSLALSFGGDY